MGFAVILIVTIALVIFFCMDCAGKINRQRALELYIWQCQCS